MRARFRAMPTYIIWAHRSWKLHHIVTQQWPSHWENGNSRKITSWTSPDHELYLNLFSAFLCVSMRDCSLSSPSLPWWEGDCPSSHQGDHSSRVLDAMHSFHLVKDLVLKLSPSPASSIICSLLYDHPITYKYTVVTSIKKRKPKLLILHFSSSHCHMALLPIQQNLLRMLSLQGFEATIK